MPSQYEIELAGDPGVGATSLVLRYAFDMLPVSNRPSNNAPYTVTKGSVSTRISDKSEINSNSSRFCEPIFN